MYRQARYDEPCIFEMGCQGARGHVVPPVEQEIRDTIGDSWAYIPQNMRRRQPPQIPELSEVAVMQHFFRLSQESTFVDSGFNAEGTCTMKYNPKVNEALAGLSKVANLHPFQDEESIQGMLEILYRLGECFRAIRGFDAVSFQPPSGTLSEFTECLMIAAHHKTDLIVPYTSHGTNAVAAKMAGFKVRSGALQPAQSLFKPPRRVRPRHGCGGGVR